LLKSINEWLKLFLKLFVKFLSSAALEFRVRSPCKGWKPKSYLVRNLNFGCDLKVIVIQVVLHHLPIQFPWFEFCGQFYQKLGSWEEGWGRKEMKVNNKWRITTSLLSWGYIQGQFGHSLLILNGVWLS